jgi:hypothetical protein
LFIGTSLLYSHVLFAFSSGYPWRYMLDIVLAVKVKNASKFVETPKR